MVKLNAHLGFQFQEFAPLERVRQAAQAGFRAVEWPNPYAIPSRTIRKVLDEYELKWIQVTLPSGDASKGEKGLAALPGREFEFEQSLQVAIEYAAEFDAKWIHPMAGVVPSWDAPGVRETYVRNLRVAATAAEHRGLGVLVEVIGTQEVPGYAMCRYERADEIFRQLADFDLKLILDSYHAQTVTGDAIGLVGQWAGRMGHVQIADAPGRHEPGTGSIDFKSFFAALEHSGYSGWVGCEYRPQTNTLEGLSYLETYLGKRADGMPVPAASSDGSPRLSKSTNTHGEYK